MPADKQVSPGSLRVLAAPDKYAGTLTGSEAAAAIAAGWLRARPGDEIIRLAVADGGEGMIDVLLDGVPGTERIDEVVADAALRPRRASWALLPDGRAIVESAQACGLSTLDPSFRDPRATTSYGVGELILAASEHGCRRIIVGVGGTATVDGGVGALAAVSGVDATTWRECGRSTLRALVRQVGAAWEGHRIELAVDVRSPLLGPDGSAFRYGPQKGATSHEDLARLESRMVDWARRVREVCGEIGIDDSELGAGGGLTFGLAAVMGATVVSGAEVVAELIGLEREVERCSLVITGEGSLDVQTTSGKAPMMVAGLARRHGIPVYAIAGRAEGPLGLFDEVLTLGPMGLVQPRKLVAERAHELALRCAAPMG
jgi:glycerate kinase